jgi:uncharacterized protein YjbI with pentapeptide repeats
MDKIELNKILKQHSLWLKDNTKGKRADLLGAYLIGANLYEADLREADLREADLQGANLLGADLRGANLKGANLQGADLSGANLEGANLEEVNLNRTGLTGTGILTFLYNRDFAYSFNGRIKIGCIDMLIDEWLDKYKEIGNENIYSEEEIELYGEFIKMCKRESK